jgi:Beta-ketoacyl synthase, N-terminal domain
MSRQQNLDRMLSFTTVLLLLSTTPSLIQCFQPPTTPSSSSTASKTTKTALFAKLDSKRVVVTGLGVVSGCGLGADDFFDACVAGKSSLGRVQRFDPTYYPCQIASEVLDFVPEDHFVNPKNVKSNDRFTHFAVAAARQALKDGGMGDTPETLFNPDGVGVMVGSAFGGVETFEQETLKLAKKPERPKVSTRVAQLYNRFRILHLTYNVISSTNKTAFTRCHRLRFRLCWETLRRELLVSNVAAEGRTTVSPRPVRVAATPLAKPWA